MSESKSKLKSCDSGNCPLRVVVAGYGPVGRCVVEELVRMEVQVTIIELNWETIERQLRLNKYPVVYGDVTDIQTLQKAKIDQADALVLTVPDEELALEACRIVRQLAPDIFIAVRTNYLSKGLQASSLGADEVVVEEIVTARAMRDAVIRRLSVGRKTQAGKRKQDGTGPSDAGRTTISRRTDARWRGSGE